MTLSFDPLTLKVCGRSGVTWSESVVNLLEIEQSPAELFIIWQILLLHHAVTLTFDPLTLNFVVSELGAIGKAVERNTMSFCDLL